MINVNIIQIKTFSIYSLRVRVCFRYGTILLLSFLVLLVRGNIIFQLLLEIFNILLRDLNEKYSIDDVQHIQD